MANEPDAVQDDEKRNPVQDDRGDGEGEREQEENGPSVSPLLFTATETLPSTAGMRTELSSACRLWPGREWCRLSPPDVL